MGNFTPCETESNRKPFIQRPNYFIMPDNKRDMSCKITSVNMSTLKPYASSHIYEAMQISNRESYTDYKKSYIFDTIIMFLQVFTYASISHIIERQRV